MNASQGHSILNLHDYDISRDRVRDLACTKKAMDLKIRIAELEKNILKHSISFKLGSIKTNLLYRTIITEVY